VFHDSTLREMATRLPQTWRKCSPISGIGQAKLEKYGEIFLEEIRKQ
jgi:ATP-dependent DNA helicase RecQ